MKPDAITIESGSLLMTLNPDQKLWTRWLGAESTTDSSLPPSFLAASGLNQNDLPPLQEVHFPLAFAHQLTEDLDLLIDDSTERDLIAQSISSLASGKARAVVTGQQPGFAGGPLYSLFKIATAVALARLHTSEGQPAVPVFWMGDDDDDWQELLDSVFLDQNTGELKGSDLTPKPGQYRHDTIGSLPFSPLEDSTSQFIEKLQPTNELSRQLKAVYLKAKVENSTLADLTEKTLRCVFQGTGLVILRGNDSRLHSHCEDFYNKAVERLPELVEKTRVQSSHAANLFGIAPLSDNSLKRPLYLSQGKVRQPWDGQSKPEDSSSWRCGVLLRSMLQDWLLQPAAGVVGPGELSYLCQLVPAYECMGLARSPLVPRVFGWILPEDLPRSILEKFLHDQPLDHARSLELAQTAGAAGEEKLVQMLTQELGLDSGRARELAAGRTRRWVKGVQALLKNESRKQVELNRPSRPPWVFPQGKRQERKLSWIPLVATWGQPMIDAVFEACEKHLQDGSQGRWNDYLIRVPLPDTSNTKGSGS